MNDKGDAAKAVSRHLHDAIERVREDVAKVEFWADAVTGFTEPVPEYKPGKVTVWLPTEQASALDANDQLESDKPDSDKPESDDKREGHAPERSGR